MADGVDIDLYADDIEQDFNQDEFAADGVDLYDDVITPSGGSGSDRGGRGDGPTNSNNSGEGRPPSTPPSNNQNNVSTNSGSFPHVGNNVHSGQQFGRRYQLYVGNLTWWTTDQDVTNAVHSLGINDFIEVKFFENRANGQSKGFCVISLGTEPSMRSCLERLPKKELHGQNPVVTFATKQALNQFEAQSKTRPSPQPNHRDNRGGGGPMPPRMMMPPNMGRGLPPPNMPPQNQRPPGLMPPGAPPPGPPRQGPPPHGFHPGGPPPHQGPPPGPPPRPMNMVPPPGAPPRGPLPPPDMRGPPPRPDWSRPPGPFPPHSQPPPGMQGPPGPHMQGPPPRGPPPPPGHVGPPPPAPHVNPAFFQQAGPPPPHGPPHAYGPPPSAAYGAPPPDHRNDLMPPVSEAEFEEIMSRNRTVSSSAIGRAVSDAAAGEYASAIETLVTAISLIKQSKVANDDRCKILISSLQDTLHGIESKSYGSSRRDRSRSRERERSHRRRRERSRSRDREYRERSRERERGIILPSGVQSTGSMMYYPEYPRERSRSRDRDREREYRERSREDSRYYEERYRDRERDREREARSRDPERERERDRERERREREERESSHRSGARH